MLAWCLTVIPWSEPRLKDDRDGVHIRARDSNLQDLGTVSYVRTQASRANRMASSSHPAGQSKC